MSAHTTTPVQYQTRFLGGDSTQPVFLAPDASGDLTLWRGMATDDYPFPMMDERGTDPMIWEWLVGHLFG